MLNDIMKIPYLNFSEIDSTNLATSLFTLKDVNKWKAVNRDNKINYENLANQLGITLNDIVRVYQNHTSNVLLASKKDGGIGITNPNPEKCYDAIVTNEKNLLITVVTADCVPIIFLDPVEKVIGIAHSGWRGTCKKISANVITMMKKNFNSNPKNIIVCLGPYICKNCFQVGEDVYEEFAKCYTKEQIDKMFANDIPSHYKLNMGEAIKFCLNEEGILDKNIHDYGLCTYHDDRFQSWRQSKNADLSMLSGIMLK